MLQSAVNLVSLHPIGVPHHPIEEEPPFGGRSDLHLHPILELLHGGTTSQEMGKRAIPEFSLSLEVTHHIHS